MKKHIIDDFYSQLFNIDSNNDKSRHYAYNYILSKLKEVGDFICKHEAKEHLTNEHGFSKFTVEKVFQDEQLINQ